MENRRTIGIMGAMHEEINDVLSLLTDYTTETFGMRTYYSGKIGDKNVVIVFSRWGKVAAATTVSTLILKYGITELIFTGVAGGISPDLNIGDVVLSKRLIQHDMDARPLMRQYDLPLLNKAFIESDSGLLQNASQAIKKLLEDRSLHQVFPSGTLEKFNISNPKLWIGDIASGDIFFSSNVQKDSLSSRLPSVLCVEMEGASVAQVCFEYQVPFVVIRTISDAADDTSHIDFPLFLEEVSSKYSTQIIKNILESQPIE